MIMHSTTLLSWLGIYLLNFGVLANDKLGLKQQEKMRTTVSMDDEITYMPKLDVQPEWKQYSGYLNGTGTRKLHYWFVESASNPSKDPLLVWMNGGPGCSAELGLLMQNGPFKIQDNGSVIYNPHSWNKVSNIIYLDSPTGVGFSYSDDRNYTTSDDQSALDNYIALKSFFKKFPEFRKNDLYVTGLSYGGIFVPLLSALVVDDPDMNFEGFAIGNGLYDNDKDNNSKVFYGYYHGLYGQSIWSKLTKYCCDGDITDCSFVKNLQKPGCKEPYQAVKDIFTKTGFDQYNIYTHCEGGEGEVEYGHHLTKHQQIIPCWKFAPVVNYLNSAEVRKQLHIPDIVQPWTPCSHAVTAPYRHQYSSVKKQFIKVLNARKRILIYHGDFDTSCNFLGGEWFVNSLEQPLITDRRPWYFVPDGDSNKHVAGFVKEFKDITFTTVMAAGHQVPVDQPQVALIMMTNFLQNKPFL